MSEYYDRDKFSGRRPGTPPPGQPGTPPPRRPAPPPPTGRPSGSGQNGNSGWWHSWPVIVILFAAGVWPVALGLLVYNIVQEDKRQTQRRTPPGQGRSADSAVQEAIRKAQERAREAEAQAQARAAQDRDAAEQRRAQAEAAQRRTPPAAAPAEKRPPTDRKARAPFSSVLMRFFGVMLLMTGGIATSSTLPDVIRFGTLYLEDLFVSLGFLACGGVLFWRGQVLASRTRRSQRYILAIGTADAMSIQEIAKRVNRTPEKAEKELQKLIDKGYLGEDAYIDHERGYFLRFGATLEEEPEARAETVQPAPEPDEEGYAGILRNIRRANDRIADEVLSRKIDRLEQVSGLIFKEVEAHPEKRERIHTFFDYYLPTTQKLLDAYAEFEATGVEGENLSQAKDRIEQTMDTIVAGFEHQLDQLYSTDAMDVVSDIKVMEAMLNRDTASAAKDFGYAQERGKPEGSDKPGGGGTPLQL